MKAERACGSWDSPIGSGDLVRAALRLSAPRLGEDCVFWLEGRPSEGGRQVVMVARRDATGRHDEISEASPAGRNVRSRVHEYGGGEYTVWRDRLYFVDDADGQIHAGRVGGASKPLTRGQACHADLVVSPDGRWLVAVEETPQTDAEPENRLIAIRLTDQGDTPGLACLGEPRVIAAGHDFYASACFAPAGDRIAFLCWDHPNMPWNGTDLEVVALDQNGSTTTPRKVAGGPTESLFQPRFDADGNLLVVSDRSGWWNLARVRKAGSEAIQRATLEVGVPQWVFGQSRWTFAHERQALAVLTEHGIDSLARVDLETGRAREVPTPFTAIGGLDLHDGWVACLAGSPTASMGLYVWSLESGSPSCVRESASVPIPEEVISRAEARTIASVGGRTTHAFVYPPCSTTSRPSPGERFPLLVKSHGGPTAATSAALDPRIQFWTSRGFAVADVNYGGSTGYGRAYRDQLEGAWGIVDVEDCVAVARALADEGLVDGQRLAISGGSAGGYTTLCALTFHDTFSAGASHYGIGDLEALARDTHKFESRYTDWLVGPLPECADRYVERSPVHHHTQLNCPVIFFQGLEDRVVPPNQAEAMVAVLAKRGIAHAYVPFEGEQHGFRMAENIRTALDGELYFYSKVFGFAAPQPVGVDVFGDIPDLRHVADIAQR